MRIGVYQFVSGSDIGTNANAIYRAIYKASDEKVRLLVFHECAACGYPPVETPDIEKIDYKAMDELLENVKKLAREKDMYIALGLIRQEKGKRYNSVCLISPEGSIMGIYDKRALWGWDLNHFERGTQSGLFDIDGVRVGFRICFEVRFPEYFRELFKEQAELCFVLFSDVSDQDSPLRYDIIKSHLITRAVENVMTVVSVNSISGFQTAPTAVFNINGAKVLEAPKNEEFLLVYDYVKPEIGYGAKGRIENSIEAINRTTL